MSREMGDSMGVAKQFLQIDLSIETPQYQDRPTKCIDDDGRLKRTGNVWTASAHIITAVIGSGVLSLAWAIAQLGWVAGPAVMLLFAFVIYYTSTLLSACYRSGDPTHGKRNYTYMDVVRTNLGGSQVKICGWIQYLNIYGSAVGYTIAASTSMMAIQKSNCFHNNGDKAQCEVSGNLYIIMFGVCQILLSLIPNFDQIWWLSIVAAVMSFTYSSVGLALGIGKVVEHGRFGGSMTGVSTIIASQKMFRSLQAFGDIAFAYAYSLILVEIQDTLKSPPSEAKTMKKASMISGTVTTIFYMLCGCMGYAAFGDNAPGNLLTGFGFYNPYWLIDIANAAIVIHLVGAYQVFSQALFAFVEKWAQQKWPKCTLINKEIRIPIPCTSLTVVDKRRICCSVNNTTYNLSLFRMAWRTAFVVTTTIISMLLPFFNDVGGVLGACGFWPMTVYYPVEVYIAHNKIPKWSCRWVCLQTLSMACLIISISAAVGSIAGVVLDLKAHRAF